MTPQQVQGAPAGMPDGTPGTTLSAPAEALRLSRTVELAPAPRSASLARAFCSRAAADWDLHEGTASSLVDVVAELVANACRYSRTRVLLTVDLGASTLTARVWDDGSELPRVLPYRAGVSDRGLGMHLVRRLSLRWGCTPDEPGKWVWAVLPRSAGPGVFYRRAGRALGLRDRP